MCMESPLVGLFRRLSKEDYHNIIEGLESVLADEKDCQKAESVQQTLSKMRDILIEYESQ
ncbi:hypothetical protein SAMN02745975_00339 [Geosporobacter subterraneus DSM 17957]|uniref:Uncharacterized protein n=1 Tax=Geosporobacter subterraneus DSM 17957 TaxID=1121919 RepID=A0A1M6D0Y3_9FIRM|nr:hypothetical protein [Geosporobacter subterraneus]SHI66773.1 hypothetical protein SAMN02745975_00339 [Geosporobacter subterraneus DSM 17957]